MGSLGADSVIDYTREDFTRTGQTYDIIFDAVGKSSFARCKGSLKPGGVYLATVPSLKLFANVLWTARLGSKKARVSATGMRSPALKAKDLGLLRELAEAGSLVPVVDSVYPMTRIADAHRRVETGHKSGCVILQLNQDDQTGYRAFTSASAVRKPTVSRSGVFAKPVHRQGTGVQNGDVAVAGPQP